MEISQSEEQEVMEFSGRRSVHQHIHLNNLINLMS